MGFQKQPQKKNQTSFSKTFQPSAGSRANKKPPVTRKMKQTVAKAALAKMGFNPMETQISLVLMYQDMLSRGVGWDKVSPITARETESFFNSIAKINADLMQYQTPKAQNNTVDEEPEDYDDFEEEDQSRPLNPSELLASKKEMTARANLSLMDKIG